MRKVVVFLFFVLLIIVIFLRFKPYFLTSSTRVATPPRVYNTSERTQREEVASVFVPYWVLTETPLEVSKYQKVLYFGIVPEENGTINTTEPGHTKLSKFNRNLPAGTDTYLVLRMLDSDTNFTIIESQSNKKRLIFETIQLAQKHDFSGVVLDLELSALPFDSVVKNITRFVTEFNQTAKKSDISFSMTMYADAYYRFRPYNIAEIGKQVDTLYLMSYDFHKARGNPGPNFPFSGKEIYGYDFQKMITDFRKDIPKEKLSVIFGMYGYDWKVDAKGKSEGQAKSLSLYKIKQHFIDVCTVRNCKYSRDSLSAESKILYTDESGSPHIIWYEDEESVKKKQAYLKETGITKFSYWAYSYFPENM